jgi:hypothetical protein
MRLANLPHVVLPLLLLAACNAGCSARAVDANNGPLPPQCTAFVAAYKSCLQKTIPSAPQIAEQRAEQTLAALQNAARSSAPGPKSLAETCDANMNRLAATCGAATTN